MAEIDGEDGGHRRRGGVGRSSRRRSAAPGDAPVVKEMKKATE